ncbi:cell wall-active antibiotics response protein [Bacillus sp. FJAT-29790]|uniref:cell wall-active antibiotics response protein LiaF n=1 Tax=Bacillus sp. FJAT-29790 TaxID=1895002 RepID=UPI001C213578|nr:cell wall-active antibiotics response protein LiaF [Bacillus sp. FJAT-29790]MBU8880473.1 cell wall-active antibiotics response protein [Bacillus sp. FJAT-29790]
MLNKVKSDYISWILLLGIVVLLLEFSFFNRGLIFSLLVDIGMIYIGRKRMPRTSGKILFWLGLIFLIISIFSMMTFKFFLLAILLHFLIQYAQSKRNPAHIRPIVMEPSLFSEKETIIKKEPLFSNFLFGQQKTPEHVYKWSDINIQAGIGDSVIDLSYTVLPKGETVIFIRNFVGNIRVLIPYDVEISVNHSVIAGTSEIFEFQETKIFNQTLQVQTPGFEQAEQKVKIFTSLLVGDLEVKRV